jgi:tetratricopeptide (TPR) repeat protein
MIRVENAITRFRRDLTLSAMLKGVLVAGAALAMFLELGDQTIISGPVALAVIGGVWLVLSYRSMKGSQMAAVSPVLIAAGDYEEAEQHIDEALRSFSLFRTVKLRSLHHLAMLRHAQHRFAESALLCRTLLHERLGVLSGISRSAHLILADSLLQQGDLHGAYESLAALYRQRLTLSEALELTAVQTDYLARISAWESIMDGVAKKAELARRSLYLTEFVSPETRKR